MKMLVVDDEEFELELARSINAAPVISMPAKGRQEGTKETPEVIRKLVADAAMDGAPAKDIAETYGVSESSVAAYKNGVTSTTQYNKGNGGSLTDFVDGKRDKIKTRAQNKLLLALKHITDEKLSEAKVSDLSTIAANMSRVVEKTMPKEQSVVNNNIVFYSPKQISKENFEAIDVSPDSGMSR
jgi:transposase